MFISFVLLYKAQSSQASKSNFHLLKFKQFEVSWIWDILLISLINQFSVTISNTILSQSQATEHLEAFIADCDRRTTAAKQRLAETQEELSQEVTEKANAVHELAEQIGQKLARAEALGEEGMVEESVMLMGEVRIFKST